MNYQHVVRAFCGEPWAMQPEKFEAMAHVLSSRAGGNEIPAETVEAAELEAAERRARVPKITGSVAVVPVMGVLVKRFGMFSRSSGFESTEALARMIHELSRNETVGAILLQIDSPGGSVFGVKELGDAIFEARQHKTIVAIADPMAASGAYWLGSQAEHFYVAPSGMVGSIGVIMVHTDISGWNEQMGVKYTYITSGRFKAEGNEDEPLKEETREYWQQQSDDYYQMFVEAVARGRGTTAKVVRSTFGEGRMLLAKQALEAGMVDKVATIEQLLVDLGARKPVSSPSAEAEHQETIESGDKPLNASMVETEAETCDDSDIERRQRQREREIAR